MYERKTQPLVPRRVFLRRLARSSSAFLAFVAVTLAIGSAGYHWIGHLAWIDAMLNASMIMTGMGPVDRMETNAAKLFAAGYALFSGVAFLTSIGVLLAPVLHRIMH